MKVLFVFNHPAPYKVRLFNELAKEIDLFVIFERKAASDRPKEFYNCSSYHFNHLFLKKGAFGAENSNTKELKDYIANHFREYDLIIMNGYSTISEIRAIKYMKRKHIPFALYVNGGVIRKESFFKKKFKQSLIKAAFHYFSPCDEASEYLEHYSVSKRLISTYIYSTVYEKDILSEPLSIEDKLLLRTKYGLPEGNLFVSCGQFIDRKNNEQLIAQFVGRKENLVLIGAGPNLRNYQSLIKEANMHNVTILDFVEKDELFKILRSCDYFVTLSKEDIFGHTTNEAMACGLPVISSDGVISSRHLIKNDYNGYLVSLRNNEEIQKAFNKVNKDMARNAILTAKENTIEASAKQHAKLFEELVK